MVAVAAAAALVAVPQEVVVQVAAPDPLDLAVAHQLVLQLVVPHDLALALLAPTEVAITVAALPCLTPLVRGHRGDLSPLLSSWVLAHWL